MSMIEHIDMLNRQAWDVRSNSPQQAIALANLASLESEREGYGPGLAQSMFILGHCSYRIAEYEAARAYSLRALARFEELGDDRGRADALNTIGNVFSGLGDYHSALNFYLQSVALRNANRQRQAEAASLNNVGNVYFHLNDYPNALESHLQSLTIKAEIGDQLGIATSLHNIANIYKESRDYPNALHHYQQSLTIFQSIGHGYGEAGSLSELGFVYATLGDLPRALDYHQQSLAIEQRTGNRHGEAESLLRLGELFLQPGLSAAHPTAITNPQEQSITYLQRALTLAYDLEAQELVYKVSLVLSQAYQQQGDFARALMHYQAFATTRHEVFNEELSEKTKKLQIIHQVETSNREAARQRAEAEVLRVTNMELVTALTNAEHQRQIADQANLLKTELLSIAAHDLKNPLGAMMGYAELILLQVTDGLSVSEVAERMLFVSKQMLTVIDNLLQSTRIDSGDMQLHLEYQDIGALAQWVIEQNRSQAARKQQMIHFSAEPDCVASIDAWRMREVLDNLVSNAIKYSPSYQPIWVCITKDQKHIQVAVKDQGQGLTSDDQQRLFSKFTRLSAQPTGDERATGLGLSIVKRLVELHGGSVWAESNGPGQGSTFFVQLPRAELAERMCSV